MIMIRKFYEAVLEKDIKGYWDDCLTWMKNVKRVDSPEKYYEFNTRFYNWAKGYLYDRIMKNMWGAGTKRELGKDVIIVRGSIGFFEWFPTAFLPTALDIRKDTKSGGGSYSVPDLERLFKEKADYEKISYYHRDMVDFAFRVFENKKQSKYVNLKKKIDDYFTSLLVYQDRRELFITSNLNVDGVKVILEYAEEDEDEIRKTLDMLRLSIKQIRKHGFSKVLRNGVFEINPNVDKEKLTPNMLNGKNLGTGGYYKYNFITDAGEIEYGRIQSFVLGDYVLELFTHEIGHKFYYEIMKDFQRKEWEDYIEGLEKYPEFDTSMNFTKKEVYVAEARALRDINDLQKEASNISTIDCKSNKEIDDKMLNVLGKEKYEAYTDPKKTIEYLFKDELKRVAEILKNRRLDDVGFDIFEHIIKTVEAKHYSSFAQLQNFGYVTVNLMRKISQEFIIYMNCFTADEKEGYKLATSYYANKNPSEFFAETFTAYCLRDSPLWDGGGFKQMTLYEEIFERFIAITGVRSASHESRKRRSHVFFV